MAATNEATNVLNMNDTAPLAVIIGGTFEGIVTGAYQLQRLIADEFAARGEEVTEASILENVVTYPVLTTEPIELSYDVNREITMRFEDKGDEDTTYLIEDIDTEFDTMDELQEFIRESLAEQTYTVEQVEYWDIKKIVSDYMEIELDGVEEDDVEITVYGANKQVCYYVEAPEPTETELEKEEADERLLAYLTSPKVDYEAMTSEQLLEQTSLIQAVVEGRLGTIEGEEVEEEKKEVPTSLHREHAYFMHAEPAMTRFLEGSPVYLFVDGDVIGLLAIGEEELRGHIRKGHSVGRHWGKQYDAE